MHPIHGSRYVTVISLGTALFSGGRCEACSGVVQLCRGYARKSVLHPLLGGGTRKTDHKGWRGAEITRRGARFGTVAVGGGLGY